MVIFYFTIVYTYINPILLNYLRQGDCLLEVVFNVVMLIKYWFN